MVDFKALLSKPAADVKRPPALPPGTYPGIIANYKFDESREKKTPFVRFGLKITGPGEDVDADALQGIDLGKREQRRDFFLTEDAQWRLTEFMTSCGIDLSGKSIGEAIPELVNCPVLIGIIQRPGQNPEEIFNDVQTLQGA